MGRKIPGKKHRTIKDPEKQRANRFAELKTKIDAPPRNADEQTIPKSLARVMKLKDDVKSGKISRTRKKRKGGSNRGLISLGGQNPKLHPRAKPEKPVPIFNQRPRESSEAFWYRVNRETHQFLKESTFEQKYKVEVKRNPKTGEIEGVRKAPKDEIDELMKLKMKHQNTGKKKKKKSSEAEPKLTKVQKRKRKLELKKERRMRNDTNDFEPLREKVGFGEVVHAPPNLLLKPLKARGSQAGKKNLLLESLFQNNKVKTVKLRSTVNKTGKRKDLPSAERRLLEKQQSNVIAAYRLLKTRKSSDVT